MSQLRLSRPGQPTVLIDQGPNAGRTSWTRYGLRPSVTGAYVVGATGKPHSRDKRPGAHSPKVRP